MELKNTIFAILAIFCVVLSACAVSAADEANQGADYYLNGNEDGHNGEIIPPDNTHDEAGHAAGEDPYLDGSQDGQNGTIIPPDVNHNEQAMNSTNSTGNATAHAAGENVTSGNSTNATAAHKMLSTGNPILALLAVGAVLGGASIIRKK